MPYPTPTLRVQFGGDMPEDIWRAGYDVTFAAGSPAWSQTELDLVMALIDSSIQATLWTAGVRGLNHGAVNLNTTIGLYYPQGSAAATVTRTLEYAGLAGTNNTNRLPNPVAVAVDKMTAGGGRRNRGRLYLPLTSAVIDATGQMATGNLGTVVSKVAEHFSAVNAIDWTGVGVTDGFVSVTSVTRTAAPYAVLSVRGDTVPDYQRRRKNRQTPTGVSQSSVTL